MNKDNYKELPELIREEFLERALKLSSALLCDGMIELGLIRDGAMDYSIKPVDDSLKMAGTAATVLTEEGDNYPVNAGLYRGKPGYVLVVDGKNNKERAYIGDLMAKTAKAKGFKGIVVDGLVRDKMDVRNIKFPVFCRGYIQRKPTKIKSGELNTVINCGGLKVAPGDLVFGDYDGVTVVPRKYIEKVLNKAEEKFENDKKREELIIEYEEAEKSGKKLPDLTPDWLK